MNGPVPTGLREKSWPIFCAAVGDSGASGESPTIRSSGAYGCLRRMRTVWASITSAPAVIVLMLVSSRSRAELMGGVRDRPRRRDQIFQRHALVRRRPFLIYADVARAVLHGRDAVGHQDIAVADVAQPTPAAHDGRPAGREPLALGKRGDQPMVGLDLHRVLEPAVLHPIRGDRHLGVE